MMKHKCKKMKIIFAHLRNGLENMRKSNPKAFDVLSIVIQVIWFAANTFFACVLNNGFVVAALILIAFIVHDIAQWALLTNRHERAFSERKKEMGNNLSELYAYTHIVAHKIKFGIARMKGNNIATVREDLVEFMTGALNQLEDILTHRYNETICASIKLCVPDSKAMKTYARGAHNIESRGGKNKVIELNKKEISIESNFAYNKIVCEKQQYFAEGNLKNLSSQGKFYCEYENWRDYFTATIVIPIRYPILGEDGTDYEVLGVVCIDAKKDKSDWTNNTECDAYHLVAFLADSMCDLLIAYRKRQQNKNNKFRKKLQTKVK